MSLADRQQRFLDFLSTQIALSGYIGALEAARKKHFTVPESGNIKWINLRHNLALSAAFADENVVAKEQTVLYALDEIQTPEVKLEVTKRLLRELRNQPDSATYPLLYTLEKRLHAMEAHLGINQVNLDDLEWRQEVVKPAR